MVLIALWCLCISVLGILIDGSLDGVVSREVECPRDLSSNSVRPFGTFFWLARTLQATSYRRSLPTREGLVLASAQCDTWNSEAGGWLVFVVLALCCVCWGGGGPGWWRLVRSKSRHRWHCAYTNPQPTLGQPQAIYIHIHIYIYIHVYARTTSTPRGPNILGNQRLKD